MAVNCLLVKHYRPNPWPSVQSVSKKEIPVQSSYAKLRHHEPLCKWTAVKAGHWSKKAAIPMASAGLQRFCQPVPQTCGTRPWIQAVIRKASDKGFEEIAAVYASTTKREVPSCTLKNKHPCGPI